MNTETKLPLKIPKYPDQARYLKKRKEQDPDFKKKVYQDNINYRKNRYLNDEEFREKTREYCKLKMREYRNKLKQDQQKQPTE